MAKFNPDVPDVREPDYLNKSKAITQPEGDKSAQYAGEAAGAAAKSIGVLAESAGKIFGQAVQGVDTYIKEDINDRVQKGYDQEKDALTQTIQKLRGQPKLLGSDDSDNGGEDTPVPTELQGIDTKVDTLSSAQESGKFPLSYYYQRLDSYFKEIRDRYPGYRDYIDKKAESVTGVNSANKFWQSMLQEINAGASATQKSQARAFSLATSQESKDLPGFAARVQKVQNGQWGIAEVAADLEGRNAPFMAMKADTKRLEYEKASGEDLKKQAERQGTAIAYSIASDQFENYKTAKGLQTGRQIADDTSAAMITGKPLTGEVAVQKEQQLRYIYQTAKERVRAKLYEKPSDGGNSPAYYIGNPQEVDKFVESTVNPIFEQHLNNLNKNRPDQTAVQAETMKARGIDYQSRYLQSDALVAWGATGDWLTSHAPNYWRDYTLQSLAKGIDQPIKNAFQLMVAGVAVPPTNPGNASSTPPSANGMIQQMRTWDPKGEQFKPEDFKSVVDIHKLITRTDVSDEAKANTANRLFMPNNRGFIDNFKKDDKYSVFRDITNPEITNQMYRLGKSNPDLWQNYKNYVQVEFGDRLFTREIKELNEVKENPNVHISWDTEHHRFGVTTSGKIRDISESNTDRSMNQPYIDRLNATVANLNKGLTGLSAIAKTEPGNDVDAYLLRRMQIAGFDPANGVSGIPRQVYDAIMNGRKAEDGVNPKAPGKPQDAPGSRRTDGVPSSIPHFAEDTTAPSISQWRSMLEGTKPQDRTEVLPSKKVWGDKEAEEAGLYEPLKNAPKGMTVQQFLRAKNGR